MPSLSPGNRTTGELLIIGVGFTVCGYVIVTGTMIAILQALGKNTGGTAQNLADIINTLIGVLAGFLAGRTDTKATTETGAPLPPTAVQRTPADPPPSNWAG